MPRVRRTGKSDNRWNAEHRRVLESGNDFFGLFRDEIDQHECWQDSKGEILPAFIAENPGRRPHGWWQFEAKARRERIDGMPHPHDVPGGDQQKRLFFGIPRMCAIARACKLAKVPLWSPNRLRHNAATELRKEFDWKPPARFLVTASPIRRSATRNLTLTRASCDCCSWLTLEV
ncbi:MAG: hypothetical protein WKF77_06160 [Planctomycetaceae bacterium]